jgi:hypothetical protein
MEPVPEWIKTATWWDGPPGQTQLDVFERVSVWCWEHNVQDEAPEIIGEIAKRMAELNPERHVGEYLLDGMWVWDGVCTAKGSKN